MRRHKLAILAAIVAAASLAGGAYAATQSGGNPRQAFLNDAARRLHVTPAQLQAALTGAAIDRLNAAVKAGRLTQAQANALEQRIRSGHALGPMGFGLRRHFFGGPRLLGPPRPLGPPPQLRAAATYLGLSTQQLVDQLRAGRTLSQIAKAHGKSVTGLEQAMLAAFRSRLDRAVTAGILTKAQEQRLLSLWSAHLARLIDHGLMLMPAPHYLGAPPAPGGPPAPGAPPPPGAPPVPGAPA